jgi:alkylation response protein AidB-like acyl-CoA dehydrogenase
MTASGDEHLIVESAIRFTEGAGGLRRARARRDAWPTFDGVIWRQMAELGWTGVCVSAERGGLGLGVREACLLLEAIGRTLTPEPLVSAIAAGYLLDRLGEGAAEVLGALLQGDVAAVPVPVANLSSPALHLENVPDWYDCTLLLLGGPHRGSFRVCALAASSPVLRAQLMECVDGSVLAAVHCNDLSYARVLSSGDAARSAFDAALDAMRLGYASYLVGLMDAALTMTLDYMKTRRQFGVPIGTFQALQHRAASCYVDIRSTRALVFEACRAFATGRQAWASAAAQARASAAALRVTKECIQLHGAIGFTDEHDIGLYLRRAMAVTARLGGESGCLRRCIEHRAREPKNGA